MKEPTLQEMQEQITKAGGLFYQYRACRQNADTIYDIENIQHGVVYAQSPLKMNDPFDSCVGFSADDLMNDTLDLFFSALPMKDDATKVVLTELIKHKALDSFAEFLKALNDLKQLISEKRKEMYQLQTPTEQFLALFLKKQYGKMPAELKRLFPKPVFLVFAMLIEKAGNVEITEETINSLLGADKALDDFKELLENIRDNVFPKQIQEFLSKITVSCFSSSGWDNQLMWAHYADSYAGMCVEYDFSQMKDFIGFVYPVQYSEIRPTLSLKDVGIEKIDLNADNKFVVGDVDIHNIINHLISKNKCWAYEKEWRIFDVGEANTPVFYRVPFIKSITIGQRIDGICRRLLIDVCKEKGIPCYELVPSVESYSLDRKQIKEEPFDFSNEIEYNTFLLNKLNKMCQGITQSCNAFSESISEDYLNCNTMAFLDAIQEVSDYTVHYYYLKLAFHNLPNKIPFNHEDTIDDSIKKAISSLESIINNYMNEVGTYKDLLNNLYRFGRIRRIEYNKALKAIEDTENISQRVFSLTLHPFFTNTKATEV